jgi:tetratricopeptide (TPR) repeat protein
MQLPFLIPSLLKHQVSSKSLGANSLTLKFSELSKKDKAHLHYLRGKVLDFLPEYTKQAEENLSKAIKLVPTKREAWDALGHVYWKKNSLQESRKCFEGSLEHEENNIETLRSLSMVCRQIQETEEKKRKDNFALSIQLANKAVGLDMKDAQSWCKSNLICRELYYSK